MTGAAYKEFNTKVYANEPYKGHMLICISRYNFDTECWVPNVGISWRDGTDFNFHKFDGPSNLFHTAEDAISHALQLGRLWVDKKL